jgi:hypothetical protein
MERRILCCVIILLFSGINGTFAQSDGYKRQVDATNDGIANGVPGDYIIRSNGKTIVLNQGDIDYAKRQLGIAKSTNNRSITNHSPNRAENGDYYGIDNDGDGRIETVYVRGYYRKNGTYVRSHYRARPRR